MWRRNISQDTRFELGCERSEEPIPLKDKRWNKVLVAITEDWFALSHFKPLLAALQRTANEVVLATRCATGKSELEDLGLKVRHVDYHRKSVNPLSQLATARQLEKIIEAEKPDVVHLVAMVPIVSGSIASWRQRPPRLVLHVTGLGHLFNSNSPHVQLARQVALAAVGRRLKQQPRWIFAENPDDLVDLSRYGIETGSRTTILGGAGVDPEEFPAMPPPNNSIVRAAFVGRLIRSKGLDVVVAAYDLLEERGVPLMIDLYGRHDAGNPEALSTETIESWSARPGINWHGQTNDVPSVWSRTDIALMPARTREGMPRSLLEAASCARPVVVTDVPGPRHFVEGGKQGILVPPDDPVSLADALQRLVENPELRKSMGAAARERLLENYTKEAVETAIEEAYARL
jgi:glycosyltransferase involved in cell wall biosynthesis